MTQPIDQVQGLPVVGQTYLVPCVRSLSTSIPWPVIGHAHVDPDYFPGEFGGTERHYHIDLRFARPGQVRCLARWTSNLVRDPETALLAALTVVIPSTSVGVIALCFRTCRRQMPLYPKRLSNADGTTNTYRALPRMEDDFAGCPVNRDCPRCPHQGTPLNGLPTDGQGRTLCPAHGLAIDLAAGVVVRRVTTDGPERVDGRAT